MTATVLDGKQVSSEIREELKKEVQQLKDQGVQPGLAVVLVGEDAASKVYVSKKAKSCEEIGVYSEVHRLAATTSQEELLQLIDKLNNDDKINGILVQLPVPDHIDDKAVIDAIALEKDVDGFHPSSVGNMVIGDDCFLPCTPHGCMVLLEKSGIDLKGKKAVVVGRSNIVGKPMAMLLLQAHATVTICHSRTKDLAAEVKEADVVIAAVGRPEMVTGEMLKEGAVVIDVGINRLDDGRLVGDVHYESAAKVASYITPVPGGVGPMTITMLLKNTVEAAKKCK
ncbi:methylenetetrahydrofolate dehydrogenase (NADP+)/methenyltetrahydrofolate cyclohydrolase [Desulfitispora alkaliphila]|uniref:bifunctional methylenetetrahydrofolate dehydrogenase/methenyltetrahydrofolate cyclohydrolase FolD n=1 Tax=Desulfitispora alkaliphila TaxID=622674 RepID=UPI003D1A84E6